MAPKDLGEEEWNSTQAASGIPQSHVFVSIRYMPSNGFCLKEFNINLMSRFSENSEKATILDRVKSRLIKLANCLLAFYVLKFGSNEFVIFVSSYRECEKTAILD